MAGKEKINTGNEEFDRLAKEIGLMSAVYVAGSTLSPDSVGNLKFRQWREVHQGAKENEPLKAKALEEMKRLAKSFDDLMKLANAETDEEAKAGIFKKLSKKARTFDNLLRLFKAMPAGDPQKEKILERMKKKATFDQWIHLFPYDIPLYSEHRPLASQMLSETAKSFDDWRRLFNNNEDPWIKKQHELALSKMLALAETLEEKALVCDLVWNTRTVLEELRTRTSKKLEAANAGFEGWFGVYRKYEDRGNSPVADIALEKLKKAAVPFDVLFKAYLHTVEGRPLKPVLLQRIKNEGTFEDFKAIVTTQTYDESTIRFIDAIAYEQMKALWPKINRPSAL